MDIQHRRITSGILAVLAATVLACGTVQGASGKAGSEVGGSGDNYLTADDNYGVRSRHTTNDSGGLGTSPAADGFGPSLQP